MGLFQGAVRPDPTFDYDPVSKRYVDLKSYASALVAATPPALSSTDTYLAGRPIDGNTLLPGKPYRGTIIGTTNGASTATMRLRLGALGTTADALLTSVAPAGTAAVTFKVVFEFIPITLGLAGTVQVLGVTTMHGLAGSAGGTPAAQAIATIDTTKPAVLGLSASVGTGTLTIYAAIVEAL